MSGVGKGVATSSIGTLLSAKGFKVNLAKVDPYLNVDAGTMNPIEHGEADVLRRHRLHEFHDHANRQAAGIGHQGGRDVLGDHDLA